MSRLSRFLELRNEKKKQKLQKKLERVKEKEQSFYKKMYGHELNNYKPFISERYDFLLVYLEDIGIDTVDDLDSHYTTITFNDGSILKFWSANKWYGWMDSGNLDCSNGKKLEWNSISLSYETTYKFKVAIEEHQRGNKSFISDDYLPIKYARKSKLKNLEKNK